jgi:hypothetical protein
MLHSTELNRFELDILDYVYRHPITPQQAAIERNEVDLGCGMIAVRLMARMGLISITTDTDNKKVLTITTSGVEKLKQHGLARSYKKAM